MMNKQDVCGIEVSAKRLLAGLEREGAARRRREFPNTTEGHTALVNWLAEPGRPVRVVMEATGLYGLGLARGVDLYRNQPAAGVSRRGGQGNRRDPAGTADLRHPLCAHARHQRANKLRACRLQVAVPLRLWEPLRILLQLSLPQPLNRRSLSFS
jgi:hypothetical protein